MGTFHWASSTPNATCPSHRHRLSSSTPAPLEQANALSDGAGIFLPDILRRELHEATRRILDRILLLRSLFRPSQSEKPPGYLLPRRGRSRHTWIAIHRKTLANAARTAVCTTAVTPHRLRHTFATTMLRLGVSLPALMQLLGHKDIHMTLLYLDVTQQDLQREFHSARQKAASLHPIPKLPLPQAITPQRVD